MELLAASEELSRQLKAITDELSGFADDLQRVREDEDE